VLEFGHASERVERFFKNLGSALGHCSLEDVEILPLVVLALFCIGFVCAFWVIGVVAYDSLFDPHLTKASLDAVSINPDNWIPR